MGINVKLRVRESQPHMTARTNPKIIVPAPGYDSIVHNAQWISPVDLICFTQGTIGVTIDDS